MNPTYTLLVSDETARAYLAGVIDSDGFIGVQRQVKSGKISHHLRVGIGGTRRESLDFAASLYGGNVNLYGKNYQWLRHGAMAYRFIYEIEPWLKIKKEQAAIAMELEHAIIDSRNIGASLLHQKDELTVELRSRHARRSKEKVLVG